ncbi:MAG TPA: hypothetical protein VMJ10_03435 [Kofleriaceae bacterium]|nr:hypothetical protein [Kofleriaceae bacterium]
MRDPEHEQLASLAVKIAAATPRDSMFRHVARQLALCALAGARGDTLYWLRVASLARLGPPELVRRALAIARRTADAAARGPQACSAR